MHIFIYCIWNSELGGGRGGGAIIFVLSQPWTPCMYVVSKTPSTGVYSREKKMVRMTDRKRPNIHLSFHQVLARAIVPDHHR